MLYALGVIIFAVGLLLSIALHEVGHMVPAKKFGVKVTQYMVGFGPTLWSRKRGDTEYGVKAIPLGGYIRMIGMVPPARGRQALALAAPDVDRDRGLPPGQPRRGRARRRAAPVLPADAGQEDDRHARRAVHEPAHLPRPHGDPADHVRRPKSTQTTTVALVIKCVVAGERDADSRRTTARRPTRPRRWRAARPATRSSRSTARRSQLGPARRRSSSRPPARSCSVTWCATATTIDPDRHAGPQPQVRRRHATRRRKPASSASRRRRATTTSQGRRSTSRPDRQPDQPRGAARSASYPQKLAACGRRCSRARSAIRRARSASSASAGSAARSPTTT